MKETILLVEDDPTLGYALSEYLKLEDFTVSWAKNGEEGLRLFKHQSFRLCILDVMMPGMDGFALARKMKETGRQVPFLFMTARNLKVDKLKGFKLGADDYITKPVDEEEMIARIRAILRRTAGEDDRQEKELTFGKIQFFPERLQVVVAGKATHITDKEGQLLTLLIRSKNQLLPREDAMRSIWGQTDYFTRKTMDVHLYNLRKILRPDTSIEIINVRGKGFILQNKLK